jgi:hypothetical protein
MLCSEQMEDMRATESKLKGLKHHVLFLSNAMTVIL